MKTIRIFISSPGDVAEERQKARDVIASLQPRYAGSFRLVSVLWEDMALQADMSFQEGIDMVLSKDRGFDIAIMILWSRIGSPPGPASLRADGTEYRSGTERELDLMLSSREASGGTRPAILAYTRNDPDGFLDQQKGQPLDKLEEMLCQRRLAENFIAKEFGSATAGSKIRAYHTFKKPVEFAHRLRVHLREILDGLLGEGGEATWDVTEKGAPFRGLEAFEPQHSGIFFGREEEICAVQLALRQQAVTGCAFVLIVGASGSGKSSLARAGVLPAVTQYDVDETVRSWRQAIFMPGTSAKDLCGGLARALCTALPELREGGNSLEALATGLRDDPGLTCRLVLPNALGDGVRLFLLVDQFEELFSHTSIATGDRGAFMLAIDALARSGSVWVLATVRSDFYDQCQTLPRLMEMKGERGQFDLLPPDSEDLRSIIVAPASLAGLRFEKNEATGEALDRRLLDDAIRHPEALPLLEYALRELFERRKPDGTLTLEQYHALGGVEGALGHRAESVFIGLPVAVQTALDGVLSALVTLREDADAGATRARIPTESAATTPERTRLIDAFVNERLFFADRDAATGEPILTLSHEALLRCWPRASQWIERNRDFLRVRARLRESLRAWTENSRTADYLLPPGKPIEDARTLLAARAEDLTQAERDYIDASIERVEKRERLATRRRRLAFAAMAFLTAVAVAGGAIAMVKTKLASDAAKVADTQRKLAEEATDRVTAQAESLRQSEAAATAAKQIAETERQRAEEATARVTAQAETLKQREAEATSARISAEKRLDQALVILDYLRKDVPMQLSEKGPLAVLQALSRRVTDFYEKLGVDENEPAQLVRRAEDAGKAGDTCMELGDMKGAETSYSDALKIATQLVALDPASNDSQLLLSVCLAKLGDLQVAREDLEGAMASYREVLKIRRQLVEKDATNKDWRLGLGVSLDKIGDLEARQAKYTAAAQRYEESQKILKQLDADDPGNKVLQRVLSVSFSKVGDSRKAHGDLDGAAESHGEAMKILQDLARRFPQSTDVQRDLSQSFTKLGRLAQDQGKAAGAVANFQQASDILDRLVASDRANAEWQLTLSTTLANLASIQHKQRDLPAAEKNFAKSVEILDQLKKAGKLHQDQSEWPAIFRENLEAVRRDLKADKK